MSKSIFDLKNNSNSFSRIQSYFVLVLRIAVGWHFLYEGLSKVFTPNWTSAGYLLVSKWIFSGLFHWIAANPTVLSIVDFLNVWGLILIGLALFWGYQTRIAALAGSFLLLLYYVANPPFIGMDFGVVTEGHYLFVDKNFIEMVALILIALTPASSLWSVDRLFHYLKRKRQLQKKDGSDKAGVEIDRREILKNLISVPFFGAFLIGVLKKRGWESYEEKNLNGVDTVTRTTIKTFDFYSLKDLTGTVPHANFCGMDISRMILGGNLIGGWTHARDLMYVSKLVKAYHHDDKVFETFWLAEKFGINAFLTNPILCQIINGYWKRNIGKIKFIADSGSTKFMERIQLSIDNGASACYVQGGKADELVQFGKLDEIEKALELIRRNGLPAGIGAHRLETVTACVEYGLKPDFWMKTLHVSDYWSAKHPEENDNIYCWNPQETIDYMKSIEQPWIAFKTLADGAIHP